MSSWYTAVGHGWSGSYGSWNGRRRGSWGGRSEVRSEEHWKLVESYRLQTNLYPGEDAGRSSVPKKTAKHIEAEQRRNNRETRRIEVEVENVAEMQENIRVRKRTAHSMQLDGTWRRADTNGLLS